MNETLYCEECGVRCDWVERIPKSFDSKTGLQKMRPVCPSGLCGHVGNSHDLKLIQRRRFWKFNSLPDLRCNKCGKTFRFPSGDDAG